MIRRDEENDRKRARKDRKSKAHRHSRFLLHIRRTHGNAAVCRCIIQTGRFDRVLFDMMMQSLRENEEFDQDDEAHHANKIKKEQSANAHRLGRQLARRVKKDWDAWYSFSAREKYLYAAYQDGTLTAERNKSAQAFGTGSLFNQQDKEIEQLALKNCFAYRTMKSYQGSWSWQPTYSNY